MVSHSVLKRPSTGAQYAGRGGAGNAFKDHDDLEPMLQQNSAIDEKAEEFN